MSKLSSLSAWTINQRFTDNRVASRLIPFLDLEDEKVLSTQEILRSTLFFNRASPRSGMELSYLNTQQKQLLVNGFEQTIRREYKLVYRNNIGKFF
ncbi:MAG: hypothetical protein HC880_11885 [Bacteroidia bacterium]|nr:hypothetical protein [Bacteroidia bacterium]